MLFNPAVDTTWERSKAQFGERGWEAAPMQHLSAGLPPMVILHGKADRTVPNVQVEKFCAEVRQLGNHCELFGFDGAGRSFFHLR